MKKLLFLIFFLVLGCSSNTDITTKISCPNVLFSAEHSKYIASEEEPITVENISYTATINNYNFEKECEITNNIMEINLSILFLANPEEAISSKIALPFYIAILNAKDKIIDMQYYVAEEKFEENKNTEKFDEKEIIKKIKNENFYRDDKGNTIKTIIIGFMLDNKKLKILN